jgi:hypothetical protein
MTLVMAIACGVAAANIYYNQPMLGIMEAPFPGQVAVTGLVPTATQLGFAAGLFLMWASTRPAGPAPTMHTGAASISIWLLRDDRRNEWPARSRHSRDGLLWFQAADYIREEEPSL